MNRTNEKQKQQIDNLQSVVRRLERLEKLIPELLDIADMCCMHELVLRDLCEQLAYDRSWLHRPVVLPDEVMGAEAGQ